MSRLVQPGERLVIAHRGASAEAPENTLPAFELALQQGADALELDVRLSRDGVPVVIHDATLDRTAHRTGWVSAFDAAELAQMDAGYQFRPRTAGTPVSFPWRGQGVGVPSLMDVLTAFPAAELLIEIKEVAAQEAVRAAIREARAEERCVVGADERAALEAFRGSATIAVCGSRPEVVALWTRAMLGLPPGRVECATLSVPLRWRGLPVATGRLFRTAAAAGLPVHVWTVNDRTVARELWGLGAAGIVTDVPARLVDTRAALAG